MQNNQQKIVQMFDEIAPSYDRANRVLSFGIDSSWRRYAVRKIGEILASEGGAAGALGAGCAAAVGGATKTLNIYDIACGTGDMCELLAKLPGACVVGVDPSVGMLEVARKRFGCELGAAGKNGAESGDDKSGTGSCCKNTYINRNACARDGEAAQMDGKCSGEMSENYEKKPSINVASASPATATTTTTGKSAVKFIQASATDIPADDDSVDVLTISYGFRNVVEKPAALAEFARVLRPGGLLCVLEFCPREKGGLIATCRDFYLARILPFLGGLISRNRAAYEYLPQSIEGFYTPAAFAQALSEAGFKMREQKSFSFGVSYMFLAQKVRANGDGADV